MSGFCFLLRVIPRALWYVFPLMRRKVKKRPAFVEESFFEVTADGQFRIATGKVDSIHRGRNVVRRHCR